MTDLIPKLADFGLMGLILGIVMLGFWQVLRTLIKQYQDERDRYWKVADERAEVVAAKLVEANDRADQRHVEIMKVLWRMNGGKDNG